MTIKDEKGERCDLSVSRDVLSLVSQQKIVSCTMRLLAKDDSFNDLKLLNMLSGRL